MAEKPKVIITCAVTGAIHTPTMSDHLPVAHDDIASAAIEADIENLVFMKKTDDKLLGDHYRWSVLAACAAQMPLATAASQMGGNVRVGLEDSLFIRRGELATSNAAQVEKIRRIVVELGSEIATPDEAREILDLKGGDRVGF